MVPDSEKDNIRQWLAERGHTSEEIEKIMTRLDEYDARMVRQAIFDSIGSGGLDIEAVIKEALDEPDRR